MTKSWNRVAAAALLAAAGALVAEPVKVDPAIPAYRRVSGISGNLNSIGSDTLNNLMTYWAEGYRKSYPNVKIQVEGKGSSTAPPALIEGTAQLGPMSREMTGAEKDKFEAKHGCKPTLVRVALDGIAVYVNKDNPIEKLTLAQVDGIFSSTRRRGGKEIRTWGDLGLTGEWASKPISLFGRNSASGTYGYFKEHALGKGDYRATVKEQPGSSSVVQGVAEDRYAIGYSGVGYTTSGVKTVKLAEKAGGDFYGESYENVLSGKYPLSRYLNVYVNKAPGRPLDPLVKEFLRFVLSKEGQEIVVKDGFFPLTAKVAAEELAKLD
ncbi:MAG TPA: phosphate ABC transporter substrate-binding protein [Thermoanaerobaculia bacterium]|nr:phosphate ABC transporter substrate-binding protein [Thermoanaerobaculia bacterium]